MTLAKRTLLVCDLCGRESLAVADWSDNMATHVIVNTHGWREVQLSYVGIYGHACPRCSNGIGDAALKDAIMARGEEAARE